MLQVRNRTGGRRAVLLDPRRESFARGLARAYGGAIIFSLPLMMTMEMWSLGSYMAPGRLGLLTLLLVPVLVGLSHVAGFESTFEWRDDLLDALVAYAVGFTASALMLALFSVIEAGQSASEIIGKIALQAVPGSIGALLAQSLLGGQRARIRSHRHAERYLEEVFLMAIGALFLAFNLAPTEEIELISYKMTDWHAIALVLVSLLIMHAFVYAVRFHGQHAPPGGAVSAALLRYTVVGYAVALLISAYVLWTFGRMDGDSLELATRLTLVLGFPAAIGAAAARLII